MVGFGAPLLTKKKKEEEEEDDDEEEEDDISNLKRLSRDCFSDLQQLREKVHRLEANQRNALRTTTGTTSGGIFHRVKAKVEAAVAPPFDDGFNVTASNRMKRGTEVKVNCETHFPKIGCVLTSGFNAEGGKMVRRFSRVDAISLSLSLSLSSRGRSRFSILYRRYLTSVRLVFSPMMRSLRKTGKSCTPSPCERCPTKYPTRYLRSSQTA